MLGRFHANRGVLDLRVIAENGRIIEGGFGVRQFLLGLHDLLLHGVPFALLNVGEFLFCGWWRGRGWFGGFLLLRRRRTARGTLFFPLAVFCEETPAAVAFQRHDG